MDAYNHELIDIHRMVAEHMGAYRHHLRGMIQDYVAATDSAWGKTVLEDFRDYIGKFWLVKPRATEMESLLNTMRQAA